MADNALEMSDEDFLKMGNSAPAVEKEEGETPPSSGSEEDNTNKDDEGNEPSNGSGTDDDATPDPSKPSDDNDDEGGPKGGDDDSQKPDDVPSGSKPDDKPVEKNKLDKDGKPIKPEEPVKDKSKTESKEPKDEAAKGTDKKQESEAKPVDYKAFYEKIMTPIRANGREIKIDNPEDAIRLMQMGAGYGKKLQDMQPHLKSMRMLEKNNLLNTDKLSYLIELDKKNPEAIKKLIKEAGIDPLDLNLEDKAEYKPVSHAVSDNEVAFQDAINDVKSHPDGFKTIQHIHEKWDQPSKQTLMENPELLKVIQTQRESGLYDQISAEVDRQRTLGNIPHNTPFINAYQIAGNSLVEAGKLANPAKPVEPKPEAKVLATERTIPTQKNANDDKAKAASPTQSTKRPASTVSNPLEMADDDFLKTFKLG